MDIEQQKKLIDKIAKTITHMGEKDDQREVAAFLNLVTFLLGEAFIDLKRIANMKEQDYKLDELAQKLYTLESENEMLRNLIEQKDKNDKGNFESEETAEVLEKISYHSKEAKPT